MVELVVMTTDFGVGSAAEKGIGSGAGTGEDFLPNFFEFAPFRVREDGAGKGLVFFSFGRVKSERTFSTQGSRESSIHSGHHFSRWRVFNLSVRKFEVDKNSLPNPGYFPFEFVDVRVPSSEKLEELDIAKDGSTIRIVKDRNNLHSLLNDQAILSKTYPADLATTLQYAQGYGDVTFCAWAKEHVKVGLSTFQAEL